MNIELKDFELAAERLKPILHHTELDHSATFSAMTGGDIYLKCENRQKTGSFKIRGASNKIAALMERGGLQAVVASSAGNHAQGVACAARKFGIPATIVMPKAAPIAKVQATENYGARVVLAGDCYDDAYKRACEICEEEGATFLHPYNDLEVIAGQGTLGLEILGDLPSVDIVIAPAGGGGLLAGVAAAIKQINPRVKVYGVQAEGADAIARSYKAKRLISTDTASTIADGIAVKSPGDITVDLINRYADGVVTVSDMEISSAILLLMERCKQIVEPAGATPLAAVLSGKLDVKGKRVILLDDMVDTAGSLCNAAKAVVEVGGAKKVYACASHGVLSGPALERLEASCIEELALLDTIPAPVGEAELAKARIKYLTVAPMFAEAIERTYQEISIAKLFN